MKKVTIRWGYYELEALDKILTTLLVCAPDADAWERCIISVLLIWQAKKLRPSLVFPNPKGHKLSLDAPTAFALKALLDFQKLDPTILVHKNLLNLSDSIQHTFFSPIS